MQTYAIVAADPAPAPAPEKTGQDQGGNPYGVFIMMGVVFVIFYLVLIRPQRKKEKERQREREQMLAALKKNDHVMTIGGIHGIVVSVGEDEVALKIDEKADVRMRVSRDAVSRVLGKEGEDAAKAGDAAKAAP